MQLMSMMDKQETHESVSSNPVLSRLERLDRILQLLEEKHSLSARHPPNSVVQQVVKQEDDLCKTLSSALEEVQHKGTLMERLTMLENRVLQLSLEMDEENTSKLSSSTVLSTEKLDHGLKSSPGSGRKDEMMHDVNEVISTKPRSPGPVAVINQDSNTSCVAEKNGHKNKIERRHRKKGHKNWLGWFRLGCN